MNFFKKNILRFLLFLLSCLPSAYHACSPLNVPGIVTQTMVGTNFIITFSNTSSWLNCPNVIDMEYACNGSPFSGLASQTFTSPPQSFASSPYTYNSFTINVSSLCAGTAYKFRIRERNNNITTSSLWSSTYTFTTSGVFTQPTLSLTASPNLICPPQIVQLGATIINGCGFPPASYSWTPSAGLTNSSIANPIASAAAATTFTCLVDGGPTGCWTASATIFLNVGLGPPVPGVAVANPSTICVYQGSTLTLNTFTGFVQWQSGPSSTGPWTNIPGANSPSYATPGLFGSTCYQALVTSCGGSTAISNAVCVTTDPIPVLTPSIGCTSSLSLLSFSNVGVSGPPTSVVWSPAPVTIGAGSTSATYSNSGTVFAIAFFPDGCIASTNFAVNAPSVSLVGGSFNCSSLSSATATPSNINGPYSFSWNPTAQTTSVATGLFPGNYTVSVISNGGSCVNTATASFVSLVPLTGTVINTGTVNCYGQNTGTASVQLAGGTGFQNYTWTDANGTQNTAIATGLAAGVNTVTVTDAVTFCSFSQTFQIFSPSATTLVITANSPTACAGKGLTLTASNSGGTPGAGYTYTWLPGPQTATDVVTQFFPGNYGYSVSSMDAHNCLSNALITVSFVPNPVISVASTSICPNAPGTLTASGASSYTWSGGATGNIFTASPAVYTLYNVVGSAQGCTSTANGYIGLLPVPVPGYSSNSPVCNGQTILLNATGGINYFWNGPLGYNSNAQNAQVIGAGPAYSGTYQVIVTAANNCTAAASFSVLVNPTPALSVVGSTVCQGSPLNLSASSLPGSTYVWTGPYNYVAAIQNPSFPSAFVSHTGNYQVTATSPQGCTNTAVANVTVTAMPNPIFTSNAPRCEGESLGLLGSGGDTYVWHGPGGFLSGAQFPVINPVSMSADGIYTLVVTSGPCQAQVSHSITVYPLPNPVATNNGPLCETQALLLNVSPTYSNHTWVGPNAYLSFQPSPNPISPVRLAHAGVYSITVQDLHGCTSATTTTVSVLQNPNLTAVGATVCITEPAILTSSGSVTYTWNGPGINSLHQSSIYIPSASFSNTSVYTVMGTAANGCTAAVQVSLVTIPLPLPGVSISKNKVCLNSEVSLTGYGGYYYSWYKPDGSFFYSGNPLTFTASTLNYGGTYTLTVSDLRGCNASTVMSLEVIKLPVGSLVGTKMEGCVPFSSDFQYASALASATAVSTRWEIETNSISNKKFSYQFTKPGAYLIKGFFTDTINGCLNKATFTVNAYPVPLANYTYSPEKPIESIDEVSFIDRSSGEQLNKFSWYFQDYERTIGSGSTYKYFFKDAGVFPIVLVVENIWSCSDTMVKSILVAPDFHVYVPNVFTPNEDNKNDLFLPVGRGLKQYHLMVFNRWGGLVFESLDIENGWDGSFNGKNCENDVYTWKITASGVNGEYKEYMGHVNLYR